MPFLRFTIIYFIISLVVIASDYFDLHWTYLLSKPLILISIFIFFRSHTGSVNNIRFRNLLLTGFVFSLIGDVLLMFQIAGQNFLIGGLIAFLVAHLCYATGFISDMFDKRPWSQHWGQLAFSTLIVVYGAEFFIINRFDFGSLYFPVMIYCMAIVIMGVNAVMRDKYKNPKGYLKVVIGAVFFIISDSLLATNLFITPIPFSGPLILGTYVIAQYLIATGCLLDMKGVEDVLVVDKD